MYTIDVDLKDLQDIYADIQPDLSILQQGIISATQYVRDVWVAAVNGTVLPGMSGPVNDDAYAKSLATGESMKFPAFLHGVVMPINYDEGVDRIENGFGAFDMKTGLLNGPKSRPTADGKGRYNIVPFRHFTPQSNSAISVKMRMPDEVYNSAKRLKRSVPDANGRMQWGQSLDWDAPPATSWAGYTHQSSIYDGMYRVGGEKHTQYLTFRRVSTRRTIQTKNGTKMVGSAPNSWMHPGVKANPLIEAVYNYCMPEVEKNLFELAEKAFGG
jgi:hypothetical protein